MWFVGVTRSSPCCLLSLQSKMTVGPTLAQVSIKRLQNTNIRCLKEMAHVVCTPYCVMPYFSWKKREDSGYCLQIGREITRLCGAVKSKSYPTSGPGPMFLNKFINDAWQAVYVWGCSVISQKIKLTVVSPLWKEYRKVHLKGTIKSTKINIAGVMACLLILGCWETLAFLFWKLISYCLFKSVTKPSWVAFVLGW